MSISPKYFPAGHFYSPYPNLHYIVENEKEIFDYNTRITDVDLNDAVQIEFVNQIIALYPTMDFPAEKSADWRYYFENPAYSYGDGIVLNAMLRILEPKHIIEVGSGYSSCMTLDTNERFLNNSLKCTFCEPHPELLIELTERHPRSNFNIIDKSLQNIDIGIFESLQAGDVLFLDSTHVSKTYSDVNTLFFNIFPRLKRGIYIHFHDIFYPFEYPKAWIYQGRAWSEAYLLRAFLQHNHEYEIIYWSHFMTLFYPELIQKMPLYSRNIGGNFWMMKR